MKSLKKEVYLGLFLSGLKKDNSKLLVLEKYKTQKRLIISKIESKFKNNTSELFPDELLKEKIKEQKGAKAIGVNFPLTKPPCVDCKLKCPGVSACKVPEVKWLLGEYKKRNKLTSKSTKEVKIPTPYIERAIDYHVAYNLEEAFPYEPAFAPNRVGFYARGLFLRKNFKKLRFIETSTRASLWRIGKGLKVRKSVLRNFYRSEATYENKALFLNKIEKEFFLYEEDKKVLLSSKAAFESLLCALSAYYFCNKQSDGFSQRVLGGEGLEFSVPQL